ncbi:MAG: kelch repeat-containing protein [Pirellulaceae bacterium]
MFLKSSNFAESTDQMILAAIVCFVVIAPCQRVLALDSSPRSTSELRSDGQWGYIPTVGLPTPRHEASFVAVDGKFYLVGGRRINPVDLFDPVAREWTARSKTPMEMHHFQAVAIDDAIYIVGAMTGPYPNETPLEKIVVYHPAKDRFDFIHGIPEDRRRGAAGAAVYKNKIYVVGGITNGHQDGTVAWLDCYDPKTGDWKRLADAPHARDHFQAVVIGDRLYAAAGRRTSNVTKQTFQLTIPEVDVFDFKSQTWLPPQTIPNLPTPRAGNMAVAVGDKLVIGGGESGEQIAAHNEVDVFDTANNKWISAPKLQTGRHGSGFALAGSLLYTASGCAKRGGEPEQTSIEAVPVAMLTSSASGSPASKQGTTRKVAVNETLTLDFVGPDASETDEMNPFTNYRLDVTFTLGGKSTVIRGFYAADGDAANSGAEAGNVWRCRFAPPETGKWNYSATLTRGDWIAIETSPASIEGAESVQLQNASGTFTVTESPSVIPFFSEGRVRPKGRHYAHADGSTWLKFGTNSPENLLGYEDFDGTSRMAANSRSGEAAIGKPLHTYSFHAQDWKPGDPTWADGKGKNLVGGINYLASQGVNSIYFLTMNIEGDGKDVWPYHEPSDFTRFDCSKLDQWEIVIEHMLQSGLAVHFVTQETENELLLDDGNVGKHRKLYYSELISRFAHHPAVFWNIGEESGRSSWKDEKGLKSNNTAQQKWIADYLDEIDPYGNTVLIHTHSHGEDQDYGLKPLLGHKTLDGLSLQVHDPKDVHHDVLRWTRQSAKAGTAWVVSMDEIGPADYGAPTDDVDATQDKMRGDVLWGSLLAGASGVEWYFGYKMKYNDLNSEDWRAREVLWNQSRIAREFFSKFDIATLQPSDSLIMSGANYCMADAGKIFIVYRKGNEEAAGTVLDLSQAKGKFEVLWLDPVLGGELKRGSIPVVEGGGVRDLGLPPTTNRPGDSTDWVIKLEHAK